MSPPDEKTAISHDVTHGKVESRHWALDYWELTRMHKFPTGTMITFWPVGWALMMAARSNAITPIGLLELHASFFVGSIVTHCVICTINDICDIDLDRQVERTKNRPLPSGRVSMMSAWIFLLLQCGLEVVLLSFCNQGAYRLGLFGLFPVHALYPLMKRVTYMPQAYLGLAMSWGFLVGWVQVEPAADRKYLALAMLGISCWPIVYDTIYALPDMKDDIQAGVKSAAILFGSWVKPVLGFFAVTFLAIMTYVGWVNGQGASFYAVSIFGAALHLAWQLFTLKEDDNTDCTKKFLSNGDLGLIVWAGLAIDYAILTFHW